VSTAGMMRTDVRSAEAGLAKASLFQALSGRERDRLAAAGAPVQLEPGAELFAKGAPGDALFVILEGEVEVRMSFAGGREVRVAALGPGAVLGEVAVLDGGARSADAAALRRTRLWRIPRSAVIEALTAEPKASLAMLAEMSRRLRAADAALEDAATLDLGGRLARLLLEARSGALIALTQTEMARRIGASREKVNRKLHEWRARGMVEITRAGVKLLRAKELESLIERQR
jgi:CRP/FNR family transcriptional regulator, cyclic AMP receptor protein